MKKAIFLVVMLFAILTISGCGSSPQLIDARTGKEFVFSTSVGQELVITLDANPSTGYGWLEQYDNSLLKLVDAEYESANNTSGLVSSVGTQTYRFRAVQAGETQMTLTYKRPWEQQIADQKVFIITIK